MDINVTLPQWSISFLIKNISGVAATLTRSESLTTWATQNKSDVKYENISSKYTHIDSSFIDNIFGADFADMQLISKINQGICFLLCWDVNPRTYIDFNKENSKKSPKFKNGDNVTISKYKHIFDKGYVWNLSG